MEHPWPPDGYDKGKAHCRYHAVKDRYGRSYLFNLLLPREWKKLCAARWENGKNPLMRAIEAFCEYSQEGVAHRSVYDYPAHFSSPYVTVDGGELCVLDFQIIEHVEAEASLPEYTPDIFDCVEEALACLGHSQSLEIPETCVSWTVLYSSKVYMATTNDSVKPGVFPLSQGDSKG